MHFIMKRNLNVNHCRRRRWPTTEGQQELTIIRHFHSTWKEVSVVEGHLEQASRISYKIAPDIIYECSKISLLALKIKSVLQI